MQIIQKLGIPFLSGDKNFLPLYEMKLVAGRNLHSSDSLNEFIINETYCAQLGFDNPQNAIGNMLYFKNQTLPNCWCCKRF